jgi:hypothetical protein
VDSFLDEGAQAKRLHVGGGAAPRLNDMVNIFGHLRKRVLVRGRGLAEGRRRRERRDIWLVRALPDNRFRPGWGKLRLARIQALLVKARKLESYVARWLQGEMGRDLLFGQIAIIHERRVAVAVLGIVKDGGTAVQAIRATAVIWRVFFAFFVFLFTRRAP